MSQEQAVGKIPKPQLKFLLTGSLKARLATAVILAIGTASCYKIFISDRRKKRYRDYYKTYDADKDFIRMREAGVFTSVKPGGEPVQW